jgi:hypothetical protein
MDTASHLKKKTFPNFYLFKWLSKMSYQDPYLISKITSKHSNTSASASTFSKGSMPSIVLPPDTPKQASGSQIIYQEPHYFLKSSSLQSSGRSQGEGYSTVESQKSSTHSAASK